MFDLIYLSLYFHAIVLLKNRRVVHWVITSGTTSDNEWQGVVQGITTSFKKQYNEWQRMESAKSRPWRAFVFACFACLRACVLTRLVAYLACLRAWRACVLTCLRAYMLGVFLCSRACFDEMFYFLTCLRAWRA